MEESRINFQIHRGNNSNIINDLDYQYSKLVPHKLLNLNQKIKLHLFPFSEEFYILPMHNYIFPMKVLLRNVKSEGSKFAI